MKKLTLLIIAFLPLQLIAQNQSRYIELYGLINLFTPDKSLNYNLHDWKTGATY